MGPRLIGKTRELRFINAALLLLAGVLVVGAACNVAPAAPTVEQATLWVSTVERGDLVIDRRGEGQLFEGESGELFAQVRVPESQSLDLEIGQTAIVDLRVAQVEARVAELGDEIVQGIRVVHLEFTEELPQQALPGMSIDARIHVDAIRDVLYVGRPAYGQSNSRIGLFRIVADGGFAERVEVQLGRGSVNMIEIIAGLDEGDKIILSDMSHWDATSRVALR